MQAAILLVARAFQPWLLWFQIWEPGAKVIGPQSSKYSPNSPWGRAARASFPVFLDWSVICRGAAGAPGFVQEVVEYLQDQANSR